MEVVAKPVGGDDEENLVFLAVALVHAPVVRFDAVGFKLLPGSVDVVHQNGRALLAGVAPVDRKSDAHPVAFEYHRRHGVVAPFHLCHSEGRAVPLRGLVQVLHRQGEDVFAMGEGGFV